MGVAVHDKVLFPVKGSLEHGVVTEVLYHSKGDQCPVEIRVAVMDDDGEFHTFDGDEELKKLTDRPRKLLPDFDQIDQAVLVWKRLGLELTEIVKDVREKGGLTITVKPDGPIEINLSGLTVHIPVH
jgi:hypothetical protein